MRRLAPVAALLLAACATTPPPPVPTPAKPAIPQSRGDLIGLTADELGQRFGKPSFQVREGVGVKLQWAAAGCVLDAYLYPPASGSGLARVMHVDSRRPSGEDAPQASCIAALQTR